MENKTPPFVELKNQYGSFVACVIVALIGAFSVICALAIMVFVLGSMNVIKYLLYQLIS